MKKQLIVLTNEQTKRLHQIRDYLRLRNINNTLIYLIEKFNGEFENYLKDKKNDN